MIAAVDFLQTGKDLFSKGDQKSNFWPFFPETHSEKGSDVG